MSKQSKVNLCKEMIKQVKFVKDTSKQVKSMHKLA